jgi:hypothetical protein
MSVRHVLLSIEIEGSDRDGYLLVVSSQDGSVNWDNWHQSLAKAEAAAEADYGVSANDWTNLS